MKTLNKLAFYILFFVFFCAGIWNGAKYLYEIAYSSNPKIYERCLAAEMALSDNRSNGVKNIINNIRKDDISISELRVAKYSQPYFKPANSGGIGNPFYSAIKKHNSTSCMNLHKQNSMDIPLVAWEYYVGYWFW